MLALDRKLLRDLVRLWPQALAIALVMAAGVATLVLGVGTHASLDETRSTFYERNRFADVFASVTRAPGALVAEIAAVPGVQSVEPRIEKLALLSVPGLSAPATGLFVSLPDFVPQRLNLLTIRAGRLPEPGDEREAVVSEPFAKAHGFGPGSRFEAILNGRKRTLVIVGIALSPEFIYAIGPWDLMPDDRRYGIVWMSERALAGAYDLKSAFSTVHLKLLSGASERAIIETLDGKLARYGGRGAYGRKDQLSHAFLDAELLQLKAMSRITPPIFLLAAALLVNMTLSRLIALERQQIGLLKAVGYSGGTIAAHYLKFVAAITLVGIVLGAAAGVWLGNGAARLYADFFRFPFLLFRTDPSTYMAGGAAALGAGVFGALRALREVMQLPPAIAMSPPAPPQYRRMFVGLGLSDRLPRSVLMVVRHLARWPLRTASAIVGVALATAILTGTLWVFQATEFMIDTTFHRSERQDATISFVQEMPERALFDVARLPGILAVEPYRNVAAKLRNGGVERRVAITGKPAGAMLSRVLDIDFRPVPLEGAGIALTDMLARILRVGRGDVIEVELLEGDRRTTQLPVTDVIKGYFGLTAYMNIDAANRLPREADRISGVHIRYDAVRQDELFGRLKELPKASFIALQRVSLQKFRETLARNILTMVTIYVSLGAIIAFGVVYNFARITLSEQGHELASLRVLGFTRGEVSGLLILEISLVVLVAQPVGWLFGYGFAAWTAAGFSTELVRVPLIVGRDAYGYATAITLMAALVSALVVRRRIDRLDLVEVLKTRE
ncbi:MAG: ABC transporter permease [Rhizobiales bacterium]|nr:ABC transporter permease [Hyphomicrobiales bacterium]